MYSTYSIRTTEQTILLYLYVHVLSIPLTAISAMQFNSSDSPMTDNLKFPQTEDLLNFIVTTIPAEIEIPAELLEERLNQQIGEHGIIPRVLINGSTVWKISQLKISQLTHTLYISMKLVQKHMQTDPIYIMQKMEMISAYLLIWGPTNQYFVV